MNGPPYISARGWEMQRKPSFDFPPSNNGYRFSGTDRGKESVYLYRDLHNPFCGMYQDRHTSVFSRRPVPDLNRERWLFHQWFSGGAWEYPMGIGEMLQHHLEEADYITTGYTLQLEMEKRMDAWRSRFDVVAEHVLFPYRKFGYQKCTGPVKLDYDCHVAIVAQVIRKDGELMVQFPSLRPVDPTRSIEMIHHVMERLLAQNRPSPPSDNWHGFPKEIIDTRGSWFTHIEPVSSRYSFVTIDRDGWPAEEVVLEGRSSAITYLAVPSLFGKATKNLGIQNFSEACAYCPARPGCNPAMPEDERIAACTPPTP